MKSSILSLALVALVPAVAVAQDDFPNRPIRLVLGFTPGGLADAAARVLAESMSATLGQPVIVENKAGAGATVASEYVARSAPDGYTIFLNTVNMFGSDQILYKSVKYEMKDFTPIGNVLDTPLIVVVNKSLGVKDLQELIAKSKSMPGKIFYASHGTGQSGHLAGVIFNKLTGAFLSHVPYKGGAPAAMSVVANDTQVIFASPTGVLPFIRSGQLIPLAVTTTHRVSFLPNVPTTAEAGLPSFRYSPWMGLVGPANLPKPVVDKLFNASHKALSDPAVKEKLLRQGVIAAPSASVEEFRQRVLRDGPAEARLVKETGVSAE
jgi:tripartite-type tricarboxylate transporter receptor subunit TctC